MGRTARRVGCSPGPAGTPVTKSRYDYRYNGLGRRKDVVYSGAAFGGSGNEELDLWAYNDRNELTGAARYAGSDPDLPGAIDADLEREYTYDPIGNRLDSTSGTDPQLYYVPNELNQYDCTNDQADCTTPIETFNNDADGNLTSDGQFTYTWDAENRLVAVAPVSSPVTGDARLTLVYDYMNRRVKKTVETYDGSAWGVTAVRKFVWYDWLMLLELDGSDNSVVRRYTWGLDVAGQQGAINSLERAGGIGGLLAIQDEKFDTTTKNYLACYDGNGNLTQLLLRSDGSFQALYEYDAYGNVVNSANTYANDNPIRFSTKYWDEETGLGYWGERYYSPALGRWLSRDRIGVRDRANLYQFGHDRPTDSFDPKGSDPGGDGDDPRRPPPKAANWECEAHKQQLKCLVKNRDKCTDDNCRKAIQEAIGRTTCEIGYYCHHKNERVRRNCREAAIWVP